MSTVTKTYTPLTESLKIPVVKCCAILPNHMGCWKAGDILVVSTKPTPTEENPNQVETTQYQLCRYHAILDENAHTKQLSDETALAKAQAAEQQDQTSV
jgi:hypothetical protein